MCCQQCQLMASFTTPRTQYPPIDTDDVSLLLMRLGSEEARMSLTRRGGSRGEGVRGHGPKLMHDRLKKSCESCCRRDSVF